jgi:uncharacterized oxidoreductase
MEDDPIPSGLSRRAIMAAAVALPAAAAITPTAAVAQAGKAQGRPVLARSRPVKLTGNTVLVTGGGTGLGRGFAEAMHRMGNKVIIASRRRSILEATAAANPGMEVMTVDIRDPAAVRGFAADVVRRYPDLNVIFNNAGIMREERLLAQQPELADAMNTVETNLNGHIRLTAALLPHLQTRPQAIILNTSSGLGFVPQTSTPTYSATKAAMHSYTVSLRHQLRDSRIEVFEIAPPGVRTELTPGQSRNEEFMPVDQFIAETMAQFRQQPPPVELLVERVWVLRLAEREGRFDRMVNQLNAQA